MPNTLSPRIMDLLKGDDDTEKKSQTLSPRIMELLGQEPESPGRTAIGTLGDVGVTLAKAVVGVGESAVGLSDIPSFGLTGKALAHLGWDPEKTHEILGNLYSPAQKAANLRVQKAEGFVESVKESIKNPSTIAHATLESLPLMFGGAGLARFGLSKAPALLKAYPKLAPVVAGAMGEGLVSMGMAAEQTRQETPDGLLTPKQVAITLASGFGTGAIALAGGRMAQKLGITDVDTLMAGGITNVGTKGIIKRIIGGGLSEGVFEELPQSMQEQIWSNAAMDRPLLQGVGEAGAQGMLAGGLMGLGAGFVPGSGPGGEQQIDTTLEDQGVKEGFIDPETGEPIDQEPKAQSLSLEDQLNEWDKSRDANPLGDDDKAKDIIDQVGGALEPERDMEQQPDPMDQLTAFDALKAKLQGLTGRLVIEPKDRWTTDESAPSGEPYMTLGDQEDPEATITRSIGLNGKPFYRAYVKVDGELESLGLTSSVEQAMTTIQEDLGYVAKQAKPKAEPKESAPEKPKAEPKAEQFPVIENDIVDGKTVNKEIPNMSSIESSLTDYETLPGIREVKMSDIETTAPKDLFYAADDLKQTKELAEKIKATGQINPLIVVQDKDGLYILEGAHRLGALHEVGAKSFPALIVKDLQPSPKKPEKVTEPETFEFEQVTSSFKTKQKNPSTGEWAEVDVPVLSLSEPYNVRGKVSDGNWAVRYETPSTLGGTGKQVNTEYFTHKKDAVKWIADIKDRVQVKAPTEDKLRAEKERKKLKFDKARKGKAVKAKTLRSFIGYNYGVNINDVTFSGELNDIRWDTNAKGKRVPAKGFPVGFFNKTALSLDVQLTDVIEAGWLPPGSTDSDLLKAIEDNLAIKYGEEGVTLETEVDKDVEDLIDKEKPPEPPGFSNMIKAAQEWQGAALNADRLYDKEDKAARLEHSEMTTKGDLDAYLMKKFSIDAASARSVSNQLTFKNLPPIETAKVLDYEGEPWADTATAYNVEKKAKEKAEEKKPKAEEKTEPKPESVDVTYYEAEELAEHGYESLVTREGYDTDADAAQLLGVMQNRYPGTDIKMVRHSDRTLSAWAKIDLPDQRPGAKAWEALEVGDVFHDEVNKRYLKLVGRQIKAKHEAQALADVNNGEVWIDKGKTWAVVKEVPKGHNLAFMKTHRTKAELDKIYQDQIKQSERPDIKPDDKAKMLSDLEAAYKIESEKYPEKSAPEKPKAKKPKKPSQESLLLQVGDTVEFQRPRIDLKPFKGLIKEVIGNSYKIQGHNGLSYEVFPESGHTIKKIEAVSPDQVAAPDDWRGNLIKARKYALDLGIATQKGIREHWSDHDALVEGIEDSLGSIKPVNLKEEKEPKKASEMSASEMMAEWDKQAGEQETDDLFIDAANTEEVNAAVNTWVETGNLPDSWISRTDKPWQIRRKEGGYVGELNETHTLASKFLEDLKAKQEQDKATDDIQQLFEDGAKPTKELWQMDKGEQMRKVGRPIREHKAAIIAAHKAGETIPDNVLATFPEIDLKVKPTPKDKAEEAKQHLKNAADKFKAINKILGKEGAVGGFDEGKWSQIRPLLMDALSEVLAAGKSGAEFVALSIKGLSPAGRPYFERFVQEEIEGKKKEGTEKEDPRTAAIGVLSMNKAKQAEESGWVFGWADEIGKLSENDRTELSGPLSLGKVDQLIQAGLSAKLAKGKEGIPRETERPGTPDHLKDIDVHRQVVNEKGMKVFDNKGKPYIEVESAFDALNDIDSRLDIYDEMIDCL